VGDQPLTNQVTKLLTKAEGKKVIGIAGLYHPAMIIRGVVRGRNWTLKGRENPWNPSEGIGARFEFWHSKKEYNNRRFESPHDTSLLWDCHSRLKVSMFFKSSILRSVLMCCLGLFCNNLFHSPLHQILSTGPEALRRYARKVCLWSISLI